MVCSLIQLQTDAHYSRKRADHRSWGQRLERENANWDDIIQPLTAALLQFNMKANPTPAHEDSEPAPNGSFIYSVAVANIYTLVSTVTVASESTPSIPESLMKIGYLATTPVSPSMAISISTLELYRRIRLRQPSFSFQGFAKVICDLYSLTYNRKYATALSKGFQTYLRILKNIDKQVKGKLGWEGEDWRVKNACPPCTYKVSKETAGEGTN
jgi:hypothetical protein